MLEAFMNLLILYAAGVVVALVLAFIIVAFSDEECEEKSETRSLAYACLWSWVFVLITVMVSVERTSLWIGRKLRDIFFWVCKG
jgi:multisubunit Na+/H+ antiporter MnhB subunit